MTSVLFAAVFPASRNEPGAIIDILYDTACLPVELRIALPSRDLIPQVEDTWREGMGLVAWLTGRAT